MRSAFSSVRALKISGDQPRIRSSPDSGWAVMASKVSVRSSSRSGLCIRGKQGLDLRALLLETCPDSAKKRATSQPSPKPTTTRHTATTRGDGNVARNKGSRMSKRGFSVLGATMLAACASSQKPPEVSPTERVAQPTEGSETVLPPAPGFGGRLFDDWVKELQRRLRARQPRDPGSRRQGRPLRQRHAARSRRCPHSQHRARLPPQEPVRLGPARCRWHLRSPLQEQVPRSAARSDEEHRQSRRLDRRDSTKAKTRSLPSAKY